MLVITRQIKAARSLLGWAQFELASQAGVAISTIRRLEGLQGPIGAHFETIEKIRAAFENAGIEFMGNPSPGVRLKAQLGRELRLATGEDGRDSS
ncbi:helix-turn-helix domain-containing protein [Bradyrhizobium oligotrophicum]|uniref:helix-turn-helix domain-containing protein n=1 Tax=Bradyrhizobium oligotrophicum TaxID=44255 RepID=UPI003EBF012F